MKHALHPNAEDQATVVSLRHRYLLVVNSKTAGTTLKTIAAKAEREPLAARGGRGVDDPAQRSENWLWTPTLSDLNERWHREVLLGSSFFRFTTVRDPLTRCWSAFVDKIIGRHPEFVDRFGTQDWFPTSLNSSDELLVHFEAFVSALSSNPGLVAYDRHWAPQTLVLQFGAFPYDYVGRTENFPDVIERWADATGLPIGRYAAEVGRRNSKAVPFPAPLLSDTAWEELLHLYRADLEAFGYPSTRSASAFDPEGWEASVAKLLVASADPGHPTEEVGAQTWGRLRQTTARISRRAAVRLQPSPK